MDEIYKKLNTKHKIDYVLKLIDKGLTPQEVSEKIGYSKPSNLTRFMKNNKYSIQDNKFILKEDTCPTGNIQEDINTAEVVQEAKEDTCPTDVVEATPQPMEDTCPTINIQNQQKLIDIIDNHSKIMDIIKWFDTKEDTCPTEVIEVVTGLQINYSKSKTIKTTIRVDEDIWNTFSDICKDKYSQFSKVDILSQLLDGFNKENK